MKQRPKKPTAGRPLERTQAAGQKPPGDVPMPAGPRRKWLFRIVALFVIPLLLICGLEMIVRWSGYGYPTGFFQKIRVGDKEFLVYNEDFSRRFFPPQLERSPSPVMIEAKKPANTYRIFILGESAARGDPQMPFAASRYLEKLLAERFPETHFEVVNLGITAINSHVILPIARECARAEGDLWIIYMGNNEMVGPFGAATIFGAKAPPLGFVRLNLAIQKTRLGQWLADLGRKLKGKDPNASWGGMSMFVGNELRADDPRKEMVYQNFARNLEDIIRAGLDSGAKILLNTVAVNLKECPPFASLANSNLPAADRARFDQLYTQACSAQAQNDAAGASQEFAEASKWDPQFSELQYRWGECSLALASLAEAREHFQRACDTDALPFRADSRINGAIEKAGRHYAGGGLAFFDAASALEKDLPSGVCGQETFYEHVHFNFDGNYRLGRAWAEQVEKILPPEISRRAAANDWASRETCEQRLALTDWGRCAMTKLAMDNLRRPPLSGQSNNAQRLLSLADEIGVWRQRMTAAAAQSAVELCQAALEHSPRDYFVVENCAQFLEAVGDLRGAAAQWQRARELLPNDCLSYYQAGRLLTVLKQWPEAEAALNRAILLRPRLTEAWGVLGNLHLGTGNFEAALHDYERAAQLEPEGAAYCAYMGTALAKLNRHPEAIQRYRRALQLQPDLWEVHFALGDELESVNRIAEATREYAEVVRLNPANALAHLNWGVMEAKLGQYDAAREQFEETLRLEPGNEMAKAYMDRLQNQTNPPR